MKNSLHSFLLGFSLLLAALLSVSTSQAATVKLEWLAPEKYADVHAGEDFQQDYQDNVFRQLGLSFQKLASKLPKSHSLVIKVTNLDLAGDVFIGGVGLVRIIKDQYPPRIAFSYQYLDDKKQLLLADKVDFRDVHFMMRSTLNEYLNYEKALLTRWFKQELYPKVLP